MAHEQKLCVICGDPIDQQLGEGGHVIWADGHNAEPVGPPGSRCCTACNYDVVLPARLMGLSSTNEEN